MEMKIPSGAGTTLADIGLVGGLGGLGMDVGGQGTSGWEKKVQRRCDATSRMVTGGGAGVWGESLGRRRFCI